MKRLADAAPEGAATGNALRSCRVALRGFDGIGPGAAAAVDLAFDGSDEPALFGRGVIPVAPGGSGVAVNISRQSGPAIARVHISDIREIWKK